MKKLLAALLITLFSAGVVIAQTEPTEQDYKDLQEMRQKLIRLKKEMNAFMKDIMETSGTPGEAVLEDFGADVKVDVTENENEYIVRADLPGMDKDKIDVTLEKNRILKIAGLRNIEKNGKTPGVIRQERTAGRFERTVELPGEGMGQGMKASYGAGVLEILIPKKKGVKEEKVKVKVL